MKIPLRTFQRNIKAFTDTLSLNSATWAEVVDGAGEVVFLVADPVVGKKLPRQPICSTDSDSQLSKGGVYTNPGSNPVLTAEKIEEAIHNLSLPPAGMIEARMSANKRDKFIRLKEILDVRSSPGIPVVEAPYLNPGEPNEHDPCELCRVRSQLYEWYEDGEHRVCAACVTLRMGTKAKTWLMTAKKIDPPEELAKAVPVELHKQSTGPREPVNYCTSCKFRAVSNDAKLCSKCNVKKKKS